nr:NADH dehydrogenase subunit 2 [Peloridora minuta]
MTFNSTYYLFTTMLFMSLVVISSANTWLGIWMGLELNLMSFIPILAGSESFYKAISCLSYFLIQSLSTITLITSIFLVTYSLQYTHSMQMFILNLSFLMKIGSSPFHMWMPSVMVNLSWINCLILLTIQKLGPLIALSNMMYWPYMHIVIVLNLMVGTLGSMNQSSLRKLMAYSSITHNGWMLLGIIEGLNYWLLYFINYCILNSILIMIFYFMGTSSINQFSSSSTTPSMKMMISLSFLSLSGMPPLIGFLPKWLILEKMLETSMYFTMIMMIMFTLLSLFIYLRITFNLMVLHSCFMKMNYWKMVFSNKMLMINWLQLTLMFIFPIIM